MKYTDWSLTEIAQNVRASVLQLTQLLSIAEFATDEWNKVDWDIIDDVYLKLAEQMKEMWLSSYIEEVLDWSPNRRPPYTP